MADLTALNAAVAALTTQVESTETVEGSAETLIAGFAAETTKAVTAALTANDAADQTSIDAANAAIAQVTSRFQASASKLGDAITANTPAA